MKWSMQLDLAFKVEFGCFGDFCADFRMLQSKPFKRSFWQSVVS